MDTIWGALYKLYGEYGASQARLALISFDGERKQAILRASLDVVDNVRTAIASITSISDKPVAVHVLAVSGTVKALHGKVAA